MDILISVVIPCYNLSNDIDRCIESLRSQTFKNAEFIFVNDGSQDNTLDKILNFCSTENRAIVIDKKNEGVSIARNVGLKQARGKYILFLDGDDFISENALKTIAESVSSDCDLLIFPHNRVCADEIEGVLNLEIASGFYSQLQFLDKVTSIPISYKVYKKNVLISNNIEFDSDLTYGEVYTFAFHYISVCKTIQVISDAIYNYTKRSGSAVRKINVSKEISYINTISRIYKYAKNYPINIIDTLKFHRPIYNLFISMIFAKYIVNDLTYKSIKNIIDIFFKNSLFMQTIKYMAKNESFFTKNKYIAICFLISPRICYNLIRWMYKIR